MALRFEAPTPAGFSPTRPASLAARKVTKSGLLVANFTVVFNPGSNAGMGDADELACLQEVYNSLTAEGWSIDSIQQTSDQPPTRNITDDGKPVPVLPVTPPPIISVAPPVVGPDVVQDDQKTKPGKR
jgi:hypothetical protein